MKTQLRKELSIFVYNSIYREEDQNLFMFKHSGISVNLLIKRGWEFNLSIKFNGKLMNEIVGFYLDMLVDGTFLTYIVNKVMEVFTDGK